MNAVKVESIFFAEDIGSAARRYELLAGVEKHHPGNK
jgi:hypothetical protein